VRRVNDQWTVKQSVRGERPMSSFTNKSPVACSLARETPEFPRIAIYGFECATRENHFDICNRRVLLLLLLGGRPPVYAHR